MQRWIALKMNPAENIFLNEDSSHFVVKLGHCCAGDHINDRMGTLCNLGRLECFVLS